MSAMIIIAIIAVATLLTRQENTQILYSDQTETEPIKIGFIGPLTGEASVVGLPNKAVIEYAVEQINNANGINGRKVVIKFEDGKCNQKESISSARKLIEYDSVNYIIGGYCSTESLAIAPIAMENKVLLFSPTSSHPDLTNAGPYFFRNYPSDAYQGVFASRFLINENLTRVAVIAGQTDYAQGVAQTFSDDFTKNNGSIAYRANVGIKEQDFRGIIVKIQSTKPQAIYAPTGTLKQGIEFIGQLREAGVTIPIIGPESWNDQEMLKENGELLEGVMFVAIDTPPIPDEIINGMKKYCPTCSTGPGILQSYDAVMILADAIKNAGDNPDKVKNELHKTDYNGLSGVIEFDGNGDLKNASYSIKKMQNNSIVAVE